MMKTKLDLEKEYGLVLEGGGARGAYQIGAWKALREAGVKIKGVAGTSVGALNGAFICMDELERAEEIWSSIAYSKIFDVEEQTFRSLQAMDLRSLKFSDLTQLAKKLFSGRGFDITPLKKLIAENVDEEKIRNSPIEFFVTAFSVTDRKEVNFDMKTAPPGAMKDMLLASGYFPGFKNERLGGKFYLDGGSVNNVPVDVLADRGYRDILVIRIYGIGVDREKQFELPDDVNLYRIAPRVNLGGIMKFDGRQARRNMILGYYDAKRFLYGLEGRKYYLDMPFPESYYFDRLMKELALLKQYLEPFVRPGDMEKISGIRAYTEQIFPALAKKFRLPASWDYRDLYAAILEICAKKMGYEVFRVYTPEEIEGPVHERLRGAASVQGQPQAGEASFLGSEAENSRPAQDRSEEERVGDGPDVRN